MLKMTSVKKRNLVLVSFMGKYVNKNIIYVKDWRKLEINVLKYHRCTAFLFSPESITAIDMHVQN